MKFLSKVVWSEGMHLGPHHFQAQNRNFEDLFRFVTNSVCAHPYGFSGLKLDPDAIANGTASVLHAAGMFPDGLAFSCPDSDELPEALPVAELFSPILDSLILYLAVPVRREGGRNCALPETASGDARYTATATTVHDENTGVDERSIYFGRKNIRLIPEKKLGDHLTALPVARVLRDGAGKFVFDRTFIPPCTMASSSDGLMHLTRRLIEILEEKSSSVGASSGPGSTELSSREIASFWFAHAVNSALVPLRHIWLSKRSHPEEIFTEMSRLAGALCTFSLSAHPSSLPAYNHDNLTECFTALDAHIRQHLELIIPTNCISLPLRATADFLYEADVADTRCFNPSQWVLGVRARTGEADLISRTPQLMKVCSSKFVGELVRRALPGLPLTYLPVPPSAIPRRVETQYFGISKAGPCWDHLVQTRRIGVYVPGDLPQPELELLVVLKP
jgi:type VI secretion system protein ImpJ